MMNGRAARQEYDRGGESRFGTDRFHTVSFLGHTGRSGWLGPNTKSEPNVFASIVYPYLHRPDTSIQEE